MSDCVWCGEAVAEEATASHLQCHADELAGYLAAVRGEIHLRKLIRRVLDEVDFCDDDHALVAELREAGQWP